MKLFRFRSKGRIKCGVIHDGQYLDASRIFKNYDRAFFEKNGLDKLRAALENGDERLQPMALPVGREFAEPVGIPSKIICIGLNYARHASESGMELPKEPILFFKSTTAICGPNDPVIIPKNSEKTDWEVELAFVMGKKAQYVSETEALDYVAGYLVHNDYSERAYQLERGGQWVKGKSCDSFAPLGPFLVEKSEVLNPHALHLWLDVNGKRMQDSNTDDMVFKIPFLVHYISQFMTLLPGDIVTTGTPFGVALGMNPSPYLRPGDVVTLGIEHLGEQCQTAEAHRE